MKRRNLALSLLFFLSGLPLLAQDTVAYKLSTPFTFIKGDVNVIHNSVTLSPLYEKLYQVKKLKNSSVNLLQIGDSHIQADFLSGTIRRLVQEEFGNAGRGLVFPGRVARTNESATIYSSSNVPWEAKRIVFTNQPLPIGIGAMTIQTTQAGGTLSIKTVNTDKLNYSFNTVTLFFQKDFTSYHVAVRDSIGQEVAYIGPYTFESHPNSSRVLLPYLTNKIDLQIKQATSQQKQLTLFGLNLENGKPGVLFHSVGGNGAKFRHYLEAGYFAEQSSVLHPDLIIISLGTNEAIEYPYVDPQFLTQLDTFVSRLKSANPQAIFLLTTPADFYKRKTRRNPGVEVIRNKLIQFADEKGIAYWDLYTTAGGKHAADLWKSNGLMQSDGVHFTRSGYELQGNLFYDALIKGYNEYVLFRYP